MAMARARMVAAGALTLALSGTAIGMDGKRKGPGKEYDRNGAVQSEGIWKDDYLTGPARIYYPSGKLKAQVNYMGGLMHDDPYKELYESGELLSKSTMIFGKREGPFEEYYKSGKLKREGSFKDGLEEGVFKNYSEAGYVESDDFYEKGALLHHKKYDKRGKIVAEKFFYDRSQ